MSIELPVLRLGLAGFSASSQERVAGLLETLSSSSSVHWEVGPFAQSDAWWVNGARTQLLADGTLRVASGVPAGRSLHLNLSEVDRPIAFAQPIAPRDFEPTYSFDPTVPQSMVHVLGEFEVWLRPVIAQFGLASQILEHETVLGSGVYHVTSAGRLLAIVNLRGDVAVNVSATPLDFDDAMWTPRAPTDTIAPDNFVRTSLAQLMWRYALRTARDVLPARYRKNTLYFRNSPRLPQKLLSDSHLLLLRELALAPSSFAELIPRTGLDPVLLARDLAALYLVGAITSNAKRAATGGIRRPDAMDSIGGLPHSIQPDTDSRSGPVSGPRPPLPPADLTAPAPMSLD